MIQSQRVAGLLFLVVTLITAVVYFLTLYPTVPFWDAGEFIAVSNILGIPHPPGTPFYVLIGRIATLVPWASIAERVNALSAIAGALAVGLTYLTTLRLIRKAQGETRAPWQEVVAHVGAATGALLLAFSDAFWENSTEAEVYQLMSLAQILVFWLGLKWWAAHDQKPTVSYLLLATYIMWLCVGLHLGVGIMGLPLFVLVALVDWKVALLFAMPFLSLLRVPAGLEKMGGAVILLAAATSFAMVWQRKLPGWVATAGALLALPGLYSAMTDADFTMPTLVATAVGVVFPFLFLARTQREGRVLLLSLFLMIAGYSTHAYLPIRAAQRPAINEGAPATWNAMRDLLERKQYGEMNMMVRRGMLSTQLDKEFWRYFRRQWLLFGTPMGGMDEPVPPATTASQGERLMHFLGRVVPPPGALVPIVLGIAGGIWLLRRERKSGLYAFMFLFLTTAAMILFLNFSDKEVRERDYFFQSGYHAFAIWIGLGIAWAVAWVRDSFPEGRTRTSATFACAGLLALQPAMLVRNLWFTHDRSGNYIARDYAYNMLAPLAPNSFMFTNGDNDTFPLWYIQEVEGFRKDVRVVNLSLLNTDWYIRQLRDEEPKVPIQLTDAQVDQLKYGAIQDPSGRVIYTNEFMVHHILQQSRRDSGWVRQPYFAVTVPEDFGYRSLFSLQGLVHEVKADSTQAGIDVPAVEKAINETFKYRGLFTADGAWDSTVYKDENASTLSRNYASAHLQLAYLYRRQGQMEKAVNEMLRIQKMFPDYAEVQIPLGGFYMEMGDTARAQALFEKLVRTHPGNPDAHYYYGASLAMQGQIAPAMQQFELAITLDPDFAMAYYGAYTTLREVGERERSLAFLERWLLRNPNDTQAAQLLDAERQALGLAPRSGGFVRPPMPSMP